MRPLHYIFAGFARFKKCSPNLTYIQLFLYEQALQSLPPGLRDGRADGGRRVHEHVGGVAGSQGPGLHPVQHRVAAVVALHGVAGEAQGGGGQGEQPQPVPGASCIRVKIPVNQSYPPKSYSSLAWSPHLTLDLPSLDTASPAM